MKWSGDLSTLGKVRHDLVGNFRSQGIDLGYNTEEDAKIVVTEALTNCATHIPTGDGKCPEVEIRVAVSNREIIVTLESECYRDPKEVQRWFEKRSYSDDQSETGRGATLMNALSDPRFKSGSIEFGFKLPVVHEVSNLELAMAV